MVKLTEGQILSAAWAVFKSEHPKLFYGSAEGKYLANRIETAFIAGYISAEAIQRELQTHLHTLEKP